MVQFELKKKRKKRKNLMKRIEINEKQKKKQI
jgi:hypothetical protein